MFLSDSRDNACSTSYIYIYTYVHIYIYIYLSIYLSIYVYMRFQHESDICRLDGMARKSAMVLARVGFDFAKPLRNPCLLRALFEVCH